MEPLLQVPHYWAGITISAQKSFPTSRNSRWKETTGIQAFFDGVLGSLATGGSYAETLRIPVASQRRVDGEREGEKRQWNRDEPKGLLRHIRSCLSPLPYQLTQTGTPPSHISTVPSKSRLGQGVPACYFHLTSTYTSLPAGSSFVAADLSFGAAPCVTSSSLTRYICLLAKDIRAPPSFPPNYPECLTVLLCAETLAVIVHHPLFGQINTWLRTSAAVSRTHSSSHRLPNYSTTILCLPDTVTHHRLNLTCIYRTSALWLSPSRTNSALGLFQRRYISSDTASV